MNLRGLLTLVAGVGLVMGMGSCAALAQAPASEGHGHEAHVKAAPVESAVCLLVPVGGSGVSGVVRFVKKGDAIAVLGKITGLTPGKHGFHVHELGDLSDTRQGLSVAGHFNPTHAKHGNREDKERHAGDFGNVEADGQGVATVDFTDSIIRLTGPHGLLGRSLVVHAGEDKFTQPVGDAGGRVAFGVIGVAAPPKEKPAK